jgi:hypothetical protein
MSHHTGVPLAISRATQGRWSCSKGPGVQQILGFVPFTVSISYVR